MLYLMADDSYRFPRRTVLRATGAGSLGGIAGLAGCIGDGGNGNGDGDAEYSWRIGTSGEETATHASGVAFSNVVNEHSDRISMSAQTTGGTTANNRLIDEGEVDIAQSTHNLLWRANQDVPPYDDPPIEKALCHTFSYMTLDVFLTRRDSDELEGVETVADIPEGTRVSFGPRGTSAYDVLSDGHEILGIDFEDKYEMEFMGLGDQADAMREGRLDVCATYTANSKTLIGWIQELDATTEIDVCEWDISQEEASQAEAPVFVTDIPGDVWEQDIQHDQFTGLPVGYTSVFPAEIDDEAVYEYTKILLENHEQVREAHAVLERHGPDFATEWLQPDGVPVHPGAEEYLKEEDLWRDELTTLDEFEG